MRIELTVPFSLDKVIPKLNIIKRRQFQENKIIHHICTDSRMIQRGDLFVAIRGNRFDGNTFIDEVNKKGAISLGNASSGAHLEVFDTANALLCIAKYYKSLFKCIKATVAITGSVGKTSTKEFLKKILSSSKNAHSSIGNYNNFIGLAHTLLSMPKDTEYLLTEMGMNHSGEISKLSRCANPNVSVITNIGTSHIGNLGDRESIAKAKLEITDGMKNGILVVPDNEPLLAGIQNTLKVGCTQSSPYALIKKSNVKYDFFYPDGRIDDIALEISSEHMQKNAAMAITAALALKIPTQDIKHGAESISATDIRARIISLNDFTIFDDSYNSSYESVVANLKYLSKRYHHLPLGVFLGDINELGSHSENIHRSLGEAIAKFNVSNLYLKGKYAEFIAEGAMSYGLNASKIHINHNVYDTEESLQQIQSYHIPNEIILFKASHSQRFDKIADLLAEKERN